MARPTGLRGYGLLNVFSSMKMMDEMLSPFRIFYVDGANGSNSNSGLEPWNALANLHEAHSRMTAGQDDTAVILSDGTTSATARIIETLTWSKNACHIIGLGAPSMNPRSRIASLSTITAFATFIKVTASGCRFQNFSIFNDYAIANQVTWWDDGGRNYYKGVLFGGMGDATSIASVGSRVLKLGGGSASGENLFEDCIIGIDTQGRTAANANIEFSTGSKRNIFRRCYINMRAADTDPLFIISSGVNPLETWQIFDHCIFHNPYPHSSASLLAAVATLAANGNGRLIMEYCTRYGTTDWGTDATSNLQIHVDGPAVGATDDVGRGSVAIAT